MKGKIAAGPLWGGKARDPGTSKGVSITCLQRQHKMCVRACASVCVCVA